ncbi:sulfatase-like hydrolase/transferase [Clostridium hydrogeniformans]|uniref:sulfatase-like hydrolase/transferase n=1 Tax=Clostridium hydrogeniformans TaxID=349933 RepID=UPI00047FF66A|nr:sulfatase-like hydrolase/transferase [Clostridium hydrogeniformans]
MKEIEKIIEIKNELQKALENGDLHRAEELIDIYDNYGIKDVEYYNIKSILMFFKGNYKEAIDMLMNIYHKFEYNSDINYNLGLLNDKLKNYKEALYYLLKSSALDETKSELVNDMVKSWGSANIGKLNFNEVKESVMNIFYNINKNFPLKNNSITYVENNLMSIDNHRTYGVGVYDYYFKERDGIDISLNNGQIDMVKTETLPAKITKNYKAITNHKSIFPIMILNDKQKIDFKINEKGSFQLNKLLPNRFYYYPVEKNSMVELNSEKDFILGDIIEMDCDKSKPKLILNIFVDGLAYKFLKENNLEKLMPNTYEFFKNGTIVENCHSSGEWTYVSLASFFTGMFTKNHRVYHPRYGTDNLKDYKMFTEVFEKEGYFCAKIDGDWRSTPSSGYVKGMGRTLYQASIRGMHCDEVINETIEHIEAFKEKNNFIWLCIPDLHDIADEFETRISTQINTSIKDRVFDKSNETSVRKVFSTSKINRYRTQIHRLDTYIGLLLNYVKKNYKEDEFIVSLISDHGQGYLVKSEEFLDEERSNVAMMLRGKNIPKGICHEFIQGLDLFPIILNSVGAKDYEMNDSNIPKWFGGDKERDYTYTESIFPGSPYTAAINDNMHKFFFYSKNMCTEDGRIDIRDYEIKLINKITNQDETIKFNEKVTKYVEIVYNHIKDYVLI